MSDPAFIKVGENLTYDPSKPALCTNEPHVCYGTKTPAPPVPSGGGGGSTSVSGGPRGWFLPDPQFGKILHIQERIEVAPYVKLLYDKDIKKPCPPARKSIPRTKQEIFDLRTCVQDLRKKIKALELERDSALQGNLQAQHGVETLREELAQALQRITVLEQHLGEMEALARKGFDLLAALPWFTVSSLMGLAATFLIPTDLSILKWMGYSGAVVLAAIGVGSALGGSSPEQPSPVVQPPGFLPIGVIRAR